MEFEVGNTIKRTKVLKTDELKMKKGDEAKVFQTGYTDEFPIMIAIASETGNENILHRVTDEGWEKVN